MWRNSNLNWNEPWKSGTDSQLQHSSFSQNAKLLLLLAVAVSLKSLMLSNLCSFTGSSFKGIALWNYILCNGFLCFHLFTLQGLTVSAFYLGTVHRKICNQWVQCGLSSQRHIFIVSEHLNIAWVFKSRVLKGSYQPFKSQKNDKKWDCRCMWKSSYSSHYLFIAQLGNVASFPPRIPVYRHMFPVLVSLYTQSTIPLV